MMRGALCMRLTNLEFTAGGKKLLKGLTLDVQLDEFNIILGANGAGKSLLFRICNGLLTPAGGSVSWYRDGRELPRAQLSQVMVFQTPVMLKRSALENIRFVLRTKNRGAATDEAMEMLQQAGLHKRVHRPAHQLSLGEQQQLAVARAWAVRPEVLFLDEPTSSLDPRACERVEDLIGLMRASGTRIIMTTHNLAQAKRLGEKIIFMKAGRILAYQSADHFFGHPDCAEAIEFMKRESAFSIG